MKINQILLKFAIFSKNKETVLIVKSELIRQNPFVIQNQHDVLIFRFLHITFKYFVKISRGFIFLRKVNTVSNYRGIEDIVKYFIKNYIQPYLVKSLVDLAILKTLNYHWEIKVLYLGEKQITIPNFKSIFNTSLLNTQKIVWYSPYTRNKTTVLKLPVAPNRSKKYRVLTKFSFQLARTSP